MGVPKFYRWVSERYPLINTPLNGTCRAPAIDNLYLDMNGVVHNCARAAGVDDGDGRYVMSASAAAPTQDEMLLAVFKYIDMLVTLVRPRALLYMAIDGVAPRAKMNQQRSRRFRSAQERAEEHAAAAAADPYAAADASPPFDSNCITPGTVFMARLTQVLQYFAQKKLAEDASWAGLSVVLSGAEVPGEGEHKIMEYIRQQKLSGALGPHARHCLYGLDADLIMLGLVTHERHFVLLREKVDYTAFARKRSKPRSVAKLDTATFGEFELLSIGVLREYIDLEFRQALASLPDYDVERVVDDFVFMMFLVGNDFLPNLPTMDIKEGALNVMIQLYKGLIPRLGGYLSDAGTIHPSRFEVFISKLGQLEAVVLKRRGDANKRSHGGGRGGGGSKSTIAGVASDFDALWGFTPHHLGSDMDSFEEEEEELMEVAPAGSGTDPAAVPGNGATPPRRRKAKSPLAWDAVELTSVLESGVARSDAAALAPVKENYYREKMNLLKDDAAGHHALRKAYIEGLVWTLRYYYHGCASWRWFYPFHYAPMASDLVNLTDLLTGVTFERGVPFFPQEQLLSVLPASSSWCLPKPFAALMTDPRSPIAHFYPLTFDTDMNSKKNAWEAVVLLPFVDEQALLKAMASVPLEQLTADERRRNTFGEAILYTAPLPGTPERVVPSPFPDLLPPLHTAGGVASHILPPLPPGVGFVAELPPDDGPEAFVAGASWPAIRPIPVTSRTGNVNVNVFGMPSRGESLVVALGSKTRPPKDFIFFDNASQSDDDADGPTPANGDGGHAVKKSSNGHAKLSVLVTCKSVGDVVAAGMGVGSYVLVDFPWRCPALVEAVMDTNTTVQMSPAVRAVFEASGGVAPVPWQAATVESKTEKSKFSRLAATVAAEAMERRALDLGNVRVVIQARPAIGRDPLTDVVNALAPTVGSFSAATTLPCPASLAPRADGGCSAPPLRVGSRVLFTGDGPFFGTAATVMKTLDGGNRLELRFPFPTSAAKEPAFGYRVVAVERQANWLPLAKMAAKAGVHPALASRAVGSLRFTVSGGRGRDEVDLGLGVKYTGRGLIMPGYARQEGGSSGPFTYSRRCAEVLGAYRAAFPALFLALTKAAQESRGAGGGEPIFDAATLLKCPASQAAIVVADAVAWLGASELPRLPLVSISADVVSRGTVLALEREAKVASRVQASRATGTGAGSSSLVVPRSAVLLGTEPRNVGAAAIAGAAAAARSAGWVPHLGLDGLGVRAGDRVVNRSVTGPVPLGLRGTVVGVIPPGSVASAGPPPLPVLGGGPAGRGRSGSYGGGGSGGGGRSGGGGSGGGGVGAPSTEAMVEVVFDAGFVGGGSLHGRCSSQRGKAMAASQLVMLRPESNDSVYRRLWQSENAKVPAVKQSSPLPPPPSRRAAAGAKAGATSYVGATSAGLNSIVPAPGTASTAARAPPAASRGGGGGGGAGGRNGTGGGGAARTGAPSVAAGGAASVRPPLPAGATGVWKPLSWGELSRRDDGAAGAASRAASRAGPKAAAPAGPPASAARASAASFRSRGRGGAATGGGSGALPAGAAGARGAPPSGPTAPPVVMPDPSQLPLPSFASGRAAPPVVRVLGSRAAATPTSPAAAPVTAAVAGMAGQEGAPGGRRGGRPPRMGAAAARGGSAAGAAAGAPASSAGASAAGVDVSAALQSLRLHSGAAPSTTGRQKSVLLMGVSGARHSSGGRGGAATRAPPPPAAGATGPAGGVAVAATMDLKNMLGVGGPAVAAAPTPSVPSAAAPAGVVLDQGVLPVPVRSPGVPVAEARSPGAAGVLDESAYWAALQQEHTTSNVQGGGGGGGSGGGGVRGGGRQGRRGGGGVVPRGGVAAAAGGVAVDAAPSGNPEAAPAAAAATGAAPGPVLTAAGAATAATAGATAGRGRRRNRRAGGARRGGAGGGAAAAAAAAARPLARRGGEGAEKGVDGRGTGRAGRRRRGGERRR